MRTSALAAAGLGLVSTVAAVGLASPAGADPLHPEAPVVVNDSVAMWPEGMASVDVLANDTDPGDPDGSQLAFCRLPSLDLSSILTSPPAVLVTEGDGFLFGKKGQLTVLLTRTSLSSPVPVSYYVCNLTHLAPATLTVSSRAVAPVTVSKVSHKPGYVRVTNHNASRVYFTWLNMRSKRASEPGVRSIAGGATRVIKTNSRVFRWYAAIGDENNNGLADSGRVVDKRVHPTPAKKHHTKGDSLRVPAMVRSLLARLG